MTLAELSLCYKEAAEPLRLRVRELRQLLNQTDDPAQRMDLQFRIRQLSRMLAEMNELADLTAHYYDRGYWRNEKYTV